MAITDISRDWGVAPSVVRVITTDNLTAITTNGYLTLQDANIESINHGEFEWSLSDMVAIVYNGGDGFFRRDPINQTFISLATGLSNSLPDANIYVGNGSNIATAVPVSGDLTLADTGVFSIGANVVGSGQLQKNVIQYLKTTLSPA